MGRGPPSKCSQKATVAVLAGRNPALPEDIPQRPRVSLEDLPPRIKKKDVFIKICFLYFRFLTNRTAIDKI